MENDKRNGSERNDDTNDSCILIGYLAVPNVLFSFSY